jgi:hypothetical protein
VSAIRLRFPGGVGEGNALAAADAYDFVANEKRRLTHA